MNLRDIKKDIEYVIGAFIDDCSLFSAANPNADDEALGKLLDEAVDLYNELKDKVNAKVEGKKAPYFAGIRKELLEKTDALYVKLSAVVKDAGKAEKKAPAGKASPEAAEAQEGKPAAAEKKPAVKKAPAGKVSPEAAEAEKEKPAAAEKKPAVKKAPARKAAPKAAETKEEKPAAKKAAAEKKPAARKAAPKAEKDSEEKQ